MTGPKKSDATTPCPCGDVMRISLVEPLPLEPTMMQHTFVCGAWGNLASFKFLKKEFEAGSATRRVG
jgi:hypothetical protein